MNRIEVNTNLIVDKLLDDSIEVVTSTISVFNLRLIFKKSTDLEIIFDSASENKLSVEYVIEENVIANIYELRNGLKTKVQYEYNIKENAKVYLYRLNNSINMREVDIINLIGENASIDFNLKTLSTNAEKYDIYVYHDQKNTTSILNNVGICLRGNVIFNVTGVVQKGNSGSYLVQNNQIITMNKDKCQINPNLLIEEYDVNATHNANIGSFDSGSIFYLMSRGISHEEAIKLLCKGLILSNLKESYDKTEIIKCIDMYWR